MFAFSLHQTKDCSSDKRNVGVKIALIIDPFRKLLIYLPNFMCVYVFFIYFFFFFVHDFALMLSFCSIADTRETSFVSAITAAGLAYAVTRACTMGDLVECSCDKNHILHYNTHVVSDNSNGYDIDVDSSRATRFTSANHRKRRRHNANSYLRNRNIYRNVILPDGDWTWGGCGDNVMFGFRKSKDFLDARYQRLSDIRTLVKLHNNNAGRMVRR